MSDLNVKFAVYGALRKGNEDQSQVANVQQALQNSINTNQGVVQINNEAMGGDPCQGNKKHFGAVVTHNNVDYYFACEEGQTINFYHVASK